LTERVDVLSEDVDKEGHLVGKRLKVTRVGNGRVKIVTEEEGVSLGWGAVMFMGRNRFARRGLVF
jgi:hypothetical protein